MKQKTPDVAWLLVFATPLVSIQLAVAQELEPLEYFESFDQGIPVTWTVEDGYNDDLTWSVCDPGDVNAAPPFTEPFSAIVDSMSSGVAYMDEILISPALDVSRCDSPVLLEFTHAFIYYAANLQEVGDVDVSADNGATWVNVLRMSHDDFGPEFRQIDISAVAGSTSALKVRFHYYNARNEFWWIVDDVKVSCMAVPEPPPTMTLSCDGFAEPMHQVVTVKGRRPILPLKATLTDIETGSVITDVELEENPPVAIVTIASEYYDGETITPADLTEVTEASDGNIFEYNPATEQWYFHLPVADLAAGTYVVTMESTNDELYEFSPKCEAVFNR